MELQLIYNTSQIQITSKEKKGINGEAGQNGTDGQDGVDGKSAYEIWLDKGNEGTEQDFLDSLKGADGRNGTDGQNGQDGRNGVDGKDGKDGSNGLDGKSAYQIWLDEGNVGTEQDFLESLKGADGIDGQNGRDGTNGTIIENMQIVNGDLVVTYRE